MCETSDKAKGSVNFSAAMFRVCGCCVGLKKYLKLFSALHWPDVSYDRDVLYPIGIVFFFHKVKINGRSCRVFWLLVSDRHLDCLVV